MEHYLSSSVIFRIWDTLRNYFIASKTYKVLRVILSWYKNSKTNGFIERYLAKNSSLKYSLTYRIFSGAFSVLDRLWDRLYNFALACGKSSRFISFIRDAFCSDESFSSYGLLVLFFSLGFAAASLALGTFGMLKAAFAAIGIIAALLLFIGKARWKAYLDNSAFWHFFLYIFD